MDGCVKWVIFIPIVVFGGAIAIAAAIALLAAPGMIYDLAIGHQWASGVYADTVVRSPTSITIDVIFWVIVLVSFLGLRSKN